MTPSDGSRGSPAAEQGGLRLLLRRAFTLLVNNSLGQGLAFLASVAIGRLLGVPGFGEYATVMAIVFVASVAAEAGIEATLTREIARQPSISRSLLVESVRAKVAIGGCIGLVLALPPIAAALAPGPGSVNAIRLSGALLTLNAINASFSAVFRAWGRMDYVLAINLTGQSVQLAGVFAVLLLAPTVSAVVGWFVAVQLLELLGGVALFRRGEAAATRGDRDTILAVQAPGTGRKRGALALVARSRHFALAGVLGTLELRVDLFVVQLIRGATSVAAYSVAMRLHEALGLAANALLPALYPALAAARSRSGDEGEARLYTRALGYVLLTASAAAVAGVLLANPMVRLIFGSAYAPAAAPLRVLAVMLVPLLANRATTLRLYAQGREAFANAMDTTDLALRAALGWVLVSAWGAVGAAVADLTAESVVLLVYALTGAMRAPHVREVRDAWPRAPLTHVFRREK